MADPVLSLPAEGGEFLRSHRWAVLATTRRDGSPQQSMVAYALLADGRLAMSTKAHTAKWHNALRQPRVSLTLADGRVHLVLYGSVECITGEPRRSELTADVFAALSGNERVDPANLVPMLDQQRRTVLLLSVDRAIFHE